MKGFEIHINDEKLCAATYIGVVLITIDEGDNETDISIIGTEKAIGISMYWGQRKLCIGTK